MGHVCDAIVWDMCVCDVIVCAMCVMLLCGSCLWFSRQSIALHGPVYKTVAKISICLVMSTYLSVCMEYCLIGQIFTNFMLGTSTDIC